MKPTSRYKKISRTFWIRGNFSDTHEQRVSVILSTPSAKNVSFAITLFEVKDFSTSPTLLENPGTNCIKIGLPGKLILRKRKGLQEVLFSCK